MTGPTILPVDREVLADILDVLGFPQHRSLVDGTHAFGDDNGEMALRIFARHREQGEAAGREAERADDMQLTAVYMAGAARGREAERAAVVAWLSDNATRLRVEQPNKSKHFSVAEICIRTGAHTDVRKEADDVRD